MTTQLLSRTQLRQNLFNIYLELSDCEKLLIQTLTMTDKINSKVLLDLGRYVFPPVSLRNSSSDNEWKNAFEHCKTLQLLERNFGHSDYYNVNAAIVMLCLEDILKKDGLAKSIEIAVKTWSKKTLEYHVHDIPRSVRFRIAIIKGQFESLFSAYSFVDFASQNDTNWASYFNNPFNESYLNDLKISYQVTILKSILKDAQRRCEIANEACAYAMRLVHAGKNPDLDLSNSIGIYLLMSGQFETFDTFFDQLDEIPVETAAIAEAIIGNNDIALKHFELALKHYRKTTRRNTFFFEGPSGPIYLICLLRSREMKNKVKVFNLAEQASRKTPYSNETIYTIRLRSLFDRNGLFLSGDTGNGDDLSNSGQDFFDFWLRSVIAYWRGEKPPETWENEFSKALAFVTDNEFCWLATEMKQILFAFTNKTTWQTPAAQQHGKWQIVSFINAVPVEKSWERALNSLATVIPVDNKTLDVEKVARLSWHIYLPDESYHSPKITLIEQKRLKSGNWNSGKAIDLKKISNTQTNILLTEQDNIVIRILLSTDTYSWDKEPLFAAVAALAGHPAVYMSDKPSQRVDIVCEQPRLVVLPVSQGYKILFEPQLNPSINSHYVFKYETAERIIVFEIKPEHVRIAAILGESGLNVPAEGKERLLTAINALSPQLTIHTDIADAIQTSELVEPDSRPVLRLSGNRQSLFIEVLVRPINEGRMFPPGLGAVAIYETIDGKRIHSRRVLLNEKSLYKNLLELCPTLSLYLSVELLSSTIESPQECLEVLAECKAVESLATILWNESKPIVVSPTLSSSNLSLKVTSAGDWFNIEGKLNIDEKKVIPFRELLDLLDSSDGRFVQLDENRFLALSKEFQRQLERLRSFGTPHGKGTRLHSLAALALGDITEEMEGIDTCPEWKERVMAMGEILTTPFQVPTTFQGSLRDYQIDGFVWLARLAGLGAGACLADDMGLGKTVQAIALLLHRISDGPALIIAPTTVCKNWIDEINRFAPSLDTHLFSESNRDLCVKDATSGSVVVCSYGLLNTSSELLTSREWSTIIIDEAQAIKNMATQRSKVVMELRGRFRMVTTGTPIENHLGELWNIFCFVNPGLLGTITEFNRLFATPIQQHQNNDCRHRLKSLIGPFVLRRVKSQVLDELPPKTESIIYVEPNDQEVALYESLRRKALEELEEGDGRSKHLRILAQIMKLRRACCHPSLVLPDISIPGSKIEAFGECISELLDNKHRALVFSQFTDHLKIVRTYCDTKEISYQYLDGSTPAAERARRIAAFQSGESSLFLMSLKAGGVGVNLTAADYVILLDPWWNPAVEDQASARAHRMGQQRPVTIYRLITRGTIEEKIIELHKHKRDLAESLLDGGDVSGKMTADELMKLIRDSAGCDN